MPICGEALKSSDRMKEEDAENREDGEKAGVRVKVFDFENGFEAVKELEELRCLEASKRGEGEK
jgi:hypothetical protein